MFEACLYSRLLDASALDHTTEMNQCKFDIHVNRKQSITNTVKLERKKEIEKERKRIKIRSSENF